MKNYSHEGIARVSKQFFTTLNSLIAYIEECILSPKTKYNFYHDNFQTYCILACGHPIYISLIYVLEMYYLDPQLLYDVVMVVWWQICTFVLACLKDGELLLSKLSSPLTK